jgi:trimethylamine--corrinoid protein Co-methyltransferase
MFGLAGCSDSKVVDQQAAAEAALTLMSETLGGPNLIHDLGYLESGLSGSLAQLVICNEIVSWIKSSLAPTVIDTETLPLDLIDEIGPDGQYIDSEHTLRHVRDQWYPAVFDRRNFDQWQAKGSLTLGERAAQQVDKILSSHKTEPLPEDTKNAIRAVIQRAENQSARAGG